MEIHGKVLPNIENIDRRDYVNNEYGTEMMRMVPIFFQNPAMEILMKNRKTKKEPPRQEAELERVVLTPPPGPTCVNMLFGINCSEPSNEVISTPPPARTQQ